MFNSFTTIVLIQLQDPFMCPPSQKSMIGSWYSLLSHYLHLNIFNILHCYFLSVGFKVKIKFRFLVIFRIQGQRILIVSNSDEPCGQAVGGIGSTC